MTTLKLDARLYLIRATKKVSMKEEHEGLANADRVDVDMDLNDALLEGDGHLHAGALMWGYLPSHPLHQLRREGKQFERQG